MSDLPLTRVNMAMTADGKIATANRRVSSFGSPRDLTHLYELRAGADAILTGARTLNDEDVLLDPGPERFRRRRVRHGLAPAPLRIIVSGSGRVNPRARIFRTPGAPILILTTGRAPEAALNRLRDLADSVEVFGDGALDFPEALRWLRRRWKVRNLLAEGGGELNAGLFRAGLVDELHLTICPWICGGSQAPTLAGGPTAHSLADMSEFRIRSQRRVGAELFLVLRKSRG